MSSLVDIKEFIDAATQDLEVGEVLFMPNFSLFDAMSAIEIMDPRMDSALVPPGVTPPEVPFTDPNAPLVAEQVCWILDRTMSAEMGWHGGYALSQTLYTSLYMHQIAPTWQDGMVPQYFPARRYDPLRPLGLVSIVLQAGLMAIVKTCDMVWRELNKGHVFDMEDFNADKADISLLEGIQIPTVIGQLDKALSWLERWNTTDTVWKHALYNRISLRKHILLAVSANESMGDMGARVADALASYHTIRSGPVPSTPPPSSQLHAAFDPTINRRLIVIELMSIDDAWKALQSMLQGMLEICHLLESNDVLDMMMLLRLRARLPPSTNRSAYVRSLNASLLLNTLSPQAQRQWRSRGQVVNPKRPALELFLSQLVGLPISHIRAVNDWPGGTGSLTLPPGQFEEAIERLLVQHTMSLCANRPRMRRKMSRLLADWHVLWEHAVDMAVLVREDPMLKDLRRLPLGILHLRLDNVVDWTFAGFETLLYAESEWPMLYWHLVKVLGQQVQTMETLLRLLQASQGTLTDPQPEQKILKPYLFIEHPLGTLDYVRSCITYSRALRSLSRGTLLTLFARPPKGIDVSMLSKPPTACEALLMGRRFKWAYGSHYKMTKYPDEARPNLDAWMQFAAKTQTRQDGEIIQEGLKDFKEARVHLLNLIDEIPGELRKSLQLTNRRFGGYG
ncbi:N-alpha-acetyltransferase 35 [Ceratobasidium theobromae]|uniref:N-alpha-acetyltransferase 35 n=1 Tax=Ceratobasidium theobromae TaxID=1582974 RepID=A0A5N5QTX2_9AGAM|nr:N-alpha-acetyltransferase 35 [Ceratobasidium theobromae]